MKYFLIGLFTGFFHVLNAQTVDSSALARLTDAVVELQNSELMRHGTLAFCLKPVAGIPVAGTPVAGTRPLVALNHQLSLPSASTLKLVSTASALAVLGGDYTYKTYLEYDGQIVNDTLRGNLYLRGTGDPSLGSDRFKEYPNATALLNRWVNVLRKANIRYVQGRVVADASFLDDKALADSWIWGDIGNYYGAGVQGLNFNENLYRVFFRPGRNVGDPAEVIRTEPTLPYLNLTNRVTTGPTGSGDQVIIYGSPRSNEALLTGTVPRGVPTFSVKGALPDAAQYAAYALRESLISAAIGVGGGPMVLEAVSTRKSTRTVLDEYASPTLRELAQQTNWWSINLYADAFLKTAAKKLSGKSEFDDAVETLTAYWRGKGADVRGFFIKDGSGLSPSGSLTAQNLVEILNAATKNNAFPDFYESIAVLGETGTVRNLGKGTRAAGNVRAKSGSIGGTRAYAGYVTTRSGERLSFSMTAHKYDPKSSRLVGQELVRLMVLMADL
ncbi:D-alanyl-D-alanine carboxypeptidase/D-alanyl-D-alanine-endopeptidase [Rhabdobacter roseus]|uniref:D-alanyl-D-alanine carboxypeptidase/D-alanyl-D-alanine-endopeptidase (Penicillin-binding protein 4) n=1 Tax=Rhabdobacter roseus TaxID=1655419 RepID=A0A840TWX6_9BACT|nr:D-alanyl-D-alanine carboxypeptidase/D-alanyl-D-alanine-endopeptidase [Rhabdobacter roseus]MBB5287435.1 D-alanyl-D-alanine carboxypeptidase/D-alanyl-D-alanine-endopeptidase (penicillin-binding protein 4) [Rhabdobacter roseus]